MSARCMTIPLNVKHNMQKFKDFIIDNFESRIVQMGVIALGLPLVLFGAIFFWKTKTKYLYKDAEKKYVMKYAYTFERERRGGGGGKTPKNIVGVFQKKKAFIFFKKKKKY